MPEGTVLPVLVAAPAKLAATAAPERADAGTPAPADGALGMHHTHILANVDKGRSLLHRPPLRRPSHAQPGCRFRCMLRGERRLPWP